MMMPCPLDSTREHPCSESQFVTEDRMQASRATAQAPTRVMCGLAAGETPAGRPEPVSQVLSLPRANTISTILRPCLGHLHLDRRVLEI